MGLFTWANTKQAALNTMPIYLGIVLTIFIYRILLKIPQSATGIKVQHSDVLNIKLGTLPGGLPLSGWPLSHFALFAFLAFKYPDAWPFMTAMGIVWEIIEHLINVINPGRPEHQPSILGQTSDDGNADYEDVWMAGRKQDILFNSAGIITGLALNRLLRDRSPSKNL